MSDDPREDILAYLVELCGSISGINSVWRDRGDLDDQELDKLPAIIVLDGREEIAEQPNAERHIAVRGLPQIMKLRPEIVIQLYPRDTRQQLYTSGTDVPNPPGPELSEWRMKILRTIMNDPGLVGTPAGRGTDGLLTSTGGVRYLGSETDYRVGSEMTGRMMIGIELRYPFIQPRP